MSEQLTEQQKRAIDRMLRSNQETPADETIGDGVKKLLELSDEQYETLKDAIGDYVDAFFERLNR